MGYTPSIPSPWSPHPPFVRKSPENLASKTAVPPPSSKIPWSTTIKAGWASISAVISQRALAWLHGAVKLAASGRYIFRNSSEALSLAQRAPVNQKRRTWEGTVARFFVCFQKNELAFFCSWTKTVLELSRQWRKLYYMSHEYMSRAYITFTELVCECAYRMKQMKQTAGRRSRRRGRSSHRCTLLSSFLMSHVDMLGVIKHTFSNS